MNGDVEREEIEKLLPWYVTGRLDGADRSKVESYLSRHSAVAAQLDLIRDERDETVNVNEAAGYPPPDMFQRLTASLPEARFRSNDFLAPFLTIFTAPTTRSVRWAALFAGMIAIAQAGVIAGLLLRNGEHTYQEAAGSVQADGSFSALVVFSDEATATSIMRLLGEINANIVDGPKPGGVYKIRLPTSDRSPGAKDAVLRAMAERRDVIRVVLPGGD
jgi:anti-sigma factor RsiW